MMDGEHTEPQSGFDQLGQNARADARMRRDNKPFTDEQAEALLNRLMEYMQAKGLSQKRVAEHVGLSAPTLSALVTAYLAEPPKRRPFVGDADRWLQLIDEFLATAKLREDRADLRDYVETGIAQRIHGVIHAAVRNNSMAAVIGPHGSGKTLAMRGFALQREAVAVVTVDELNGDAKGATFRIYDALRLSGELTARACLGRIIAHLRRNRNTVLLVDESQKLRRGGLEVVRDIHDQSDPAGRFCVPIVFFGDAAFYKLLVRSRSGEPTSMKPQLSRRIYPVLDLEQDGSPEGRGGRLFTAEDVARVLRNSTLRLVSQQGIRWLTTLANVTGYGTLGFAVAVTRMALDITKERPLSAEHLERAMRMLVGPRAVQDVDRLAGGELLAAVG